MKKRACARIIFYQSAKKDPIAYYWQNYRQWLLYLSDLKADRQRAAAAKWQQLQRGAAQFSITLARGRAEFYPEMHVTVSGFKDEIDNQDWIIARAEHVIDDNGFTTRLELEAKIPDWIAETE